MIYIHPSYYRILTDTRLRKMQNFYTPNFFSSPNKIGVPPSWFDKENRPPEYSTLGQSRLPAVLKEVPLDTEKKHKISLLLFPEESPTTRLFPIKDFS